MSEELTAKQYWGNPETAKEWLTRGQKVLDTVSEEINTDIQSIPVFLKDVGKYYFKSALEVGAGNGRLIGALSKEFEMIKCYSCDINLELSKYVASKYRKVSVATESVDIIKMPFPDSSFDLVYTYQVLQHISPEEINKALDELLRVSKKEVWLMEGYDEPEHYSNGQRRKGTNGGTWSWFFDKMLDCYEVSTPISEKLKSMGVRMYKIKK